MKKYILALSDEAMADIEDIYDYIADEIQQPETASGYKINLIKEIQKLSVYAGSIAISQSEYIQSRYGPNARRINYKKMAIIYVVYENCAYIKGVIAGCSIR
jgi:plasmid stabilization system protein ParE